jgi:prepilin peptidase CpaA
MLVAEVLVLAWAVAVFAWDIKQRRIPNELSIGMAAVALLMLIFTGHTMLGQEWTSASFGFMAALILTLPGYVMRWLGAGDVKFLAAIGIAGGWLVVLASFAIAGLVSGAGLLLMKSVMPQVGIRQVHKRWIPFGAALAFGLVISMRVVYE